MKKVILFALVCLVASCNNSDEVEQSRDSVTSVKELRIDNVTIKEIDLFPEAFTSVGRLEIIGDKIAFADRILMTLSYFTAEGTFLSAQLGKGQGPNEVLGLSYLSDLPNSGFIALSDFGFYNFINDSTKKSFLTYDWNDTTAHSVLLNDPKGDMGNLYAIDWSPQINTNLIANLGNSFYTSLISEHPKMNAFQHESFYQETNSIGKFEVETGKLSGMGGSWPKVYLEHSFVPNLVGVSLSASKDNIYGAYRIDSLLHVFDPNLKLVEKFGVAGQNMMTAYKTTKGIDEAIDNWTLDLENQGFYSSVYADLNGEYVFRTYHPKGTNGETRLQIYQNRVLIGDVTVPKRFRVIGKIGGLFYADGVVDESLEILKIYSFAL
ncbi:MAG: hypothetical protein ACI9QN_002747 [Arcticibacterium sp.]|jgi:hypothetical protein